ncbi:MAG: rod shape-determining protein MreC [Blautia sp.]|nr:rod shape-determining protein MreC [Blautia sp.]
MKKNRPQFRINIKSRHLLGLMSVICISAMVSVLAAGVSTQPLQEIAGRVIVPFEKAIGRMSDVLTAIQERMQEKEALLLEIEELRAELDSLTTQNNKLIQDQEELTRLRTLFDLNEEYDNYPKVAAQIISKDPGNWYDTFMINKGSADGIRVNNNVIAGRGLVGIVTDVGTNWASVRSIIDDSSSVSAMTVTSQDNFVVHGDLELIDEGKLRFEQLYDLEGVVTAGERVVTSNISENYVQGLFIGYINQVKQDSNNLTKTGTIVTPIDFSHLKDVLVITVNKQDSME